MQILRYYTGNAVETLRQEVPNYLDWYYSGEGQEPPLQPLDGLRQSQLEIPDFAPRMVIDSQTPYSTDIDNALVVYEVLKCLTPHQASIERMWVYLCHCVCPDYVKYRWLGQKPKSNKVAIKKVLNHFFAKDVRALIRDNALSRLWWLGKISHDVYSEDPREFLTILLDLQDVRSALIERPSISMNRHVLRRIFFVMKEDWSDNKALFDRKVFRSWMIALNRRGGVILLDALPIKELDYLLREEAENAMADIN